MTSSSSGLVILYFVSALVLLFAVSIFSQYILLRKNQKSFWWVQKSLIYRAFVDVGVRWMNTLLHLLFGIVDPYIGIGTLKAHLFGGRRRVRYGDHSLQVIDIYYPKKLLHKKKTHVFVHGGSWGHAFIFEFSAYCKTVADALGVPVVNIEYRCYPYGNCDMMTDDIAQALIHLQKNAEALGICTNELDIIGHSAGAHLTMLLGLHIGNALTGNPSHPTLSIDACKSLYSSISSISLASGVFDVAKHFQFENNRRILFLNGVGTVSPMCPSTRGPENFHKYSPTQIIQSNPNAFLTLLRKNINFVLYSGGDDTVVSFHQSSELLDAMEAAVKGSKDAELLRTFSESVRSIYMKQLDHVKHIVNMYTSDTAERYLSSKKYHLRDLIAFGKPGTVRIEIQPPGAREDAEAEVPYEFIVLEVFDALYRSRR